MEAFKDTLPIVYNGFKIRELVRKGKTKLNQLFINCLSNVYNLPVPGISCLERKPFWLPHLLYAAMIPFCCLRLPLVGIHAHLILKLTKGWMTQDAISRWRLVFSSLKHATTLTHAWLNSVYAVHVINASDTRRKRIYIARVAFVLSTIKYKMAEEQINEATNYVSTKNTFLNLITS